MRQAQGIVVMDRDMGRPGYPTLGHAADGDTASEQLPGQGHLPMADTLPLREFFL